LGPVNEVIRSSEKLILRTNGGSQHRPRKKEEFMKSNRRGDGRVEKTIVIQVWGKMNLNRLVTQSTGKGDPLWRGGERKKRDWGGGEVRTEGSRIQ